jgi:hypothetical protein
MVTPNELAAELGISPKTLREFLRYRFTRPAAEKNTDWEVTLPMIVAAARRFP